MIRKMAGLCGVGWGRALKTNKAKQLGCGRGNRLQFEIIWRKANIT